MTKKTQTADKDPVPSLEERVATLEQLALANGWAVPQDPGITEPAE